MNKLSRVPQRHETPGSRASADINELQNVLFIMVRTRCRAMRWFININVSARTGVWDNEWLSTNLRNYLVTARQHFSITSRGISFRRREKRFSRLVTYKCRKNFSSFLCRSRWNFRDNYEKGRSEVDLESFSLRHPKFLHSREETMGGCHHLLIIYISSQKGFRWMNHVEAKVRTWPIRTSKRAAALFKSTT